MITQQYLQQHYLYEDGFLFNKTTGNRVGGPNGDGRWKTVIGGKYYYLHRLIWIYHNGAIEDLIDHRDRDVANNRIENLRVATPIQSSCNRMEGNASGFRGVDNFNGRWRAKIRFNNKHYHIGYFDTPEEASLAYKKKATELHKEFAQLECK
jgi:hypothetical protein